MNYALNVLGRLEHSVIRLPLLLMFNLGFLRFLWWVKNAFNVDIACSPPILKKNRRLILRGVKCVKNGLSNDTLWWLISDVK